MLLLQVTTVFLVAVALALAHALESPGRMRLNKEMHLATQTIYYPGFTIGGGFGEGLGMLATMALLLLMPRGTPAFWWTLASLLSLAGMQVVFWTVTQPVNRFWAARLGLTGAARRFFSPDPDRLSDKTRGVDWERLRDHWEHSHIVRTVLAAISLISLTVAVAL